VFVAPALTAPARAPICTASTVRSALPEALAAITSDRRSTTEAWVVKKS
jgi:hypothetical protein